MKKLARKFDLTKAAATFLTGLPAKQCRQLMLRVLDLAENPEPHDAKPLKGEEFKKAGLWRVDVGEYRIVYRFSESLVEVLVAGKRNDGQVYRDLKDKKF